MNAIASSHAGRNADADADAGEAHDLKGVGLKATWPRMPVLEIIRNSINHQPSSEDVYRRVLDQGLDVGVGLATVHHVLSQLGGDGWLSRNVFDGGGAVFEINEGNHDDHLICLTCGQVDEFNNEAIEALQRGVATAQGHELADHRLALYGRCAACVNSVAADARTDQAHP